MPHVYTYPAMLTAADAATRAVRRLRTSFLHADTGMLYDFAWGDRGFDLLPTAEEVARSFPNAAGWGTGMENPALSTSQYLAGVLLRQRLSADDTATAEARRLAGTLLRLFASAAHPGFLPRGLALDGASHYPDSSVDQYTMVLYALYQYCRSDLASAREQQTIRDIWHSLLRRWEAASWQERRDDGRAAFYGDVGVLRPDRSPRLLAALLGGWALTGDPHWRRTYLRKAHEHHGARMDPGLPAAGSALYVADQNQVAWRLLADLETHPQRRAAYRQRLIETAASVRQRLLAYRDFDRREHATATASSDWQWRKACVAHASAVNHGSAYNQRLRRLAPAIPYEHARVQTPFEAAHVLLLAGDSASLDFLRPHVAPLFAAYPYEQLMLSWSLYETEWDYWLAVDAGLASLA